jgi:hypothetical protein
MAIVEYVLAQTEAIDFFSFPKSRFRLKKRISVSVQYWQKLCAFFTFGNAHRTGTSP